MHNTGNPLPSLDERDLYDNILNLDKVMNSETDTWIDRFGIEKPTISAALKSAGFMPAGFDFVTGGTLQPGDRNKAVYNPAPNGDGSWYKWGGELPKTILPSSQPNPKDSANWSPISIKLDVVEKEALRRSYLEAGYNLVEGSFEQGATITSTTDVVLHEKTGKCYSGPIGQVPKGTDPLSGGFVDTSWEVLRETFSDYLESERNYMIEGRAVEGTSVTFIGDSITQGIFSGSGLTNSQFYMSYVYRVLRSIMNNADRGIGNDRGRLYETNVNMFYGAWYEVGMPGNGGAVSSAAITFPNSGVVEKELSIPAGEWIEITLREVGQIGLFYDGSSSAHTATGASVSINGIVVGSLPTPNGSIMSHTGFVTLSQDTELSDRIRITATGGTLIVSGLTIYKTSTVGVRTYSLGWSGRTFNDFNTPSKLEAIGKLINFGVSASQRKVVVLALGTNSIYQAGRAQTPTDYINSLDSLISGIVSKSANAEFMITVPPRANPSLHSVKLPFAYEDYVKLIIDYCKTNKHKILRLDNSPLSLPPYVYYNDGLHPNAQGHEIMATEMCRALGVKYDNYVKTIDFTPSITRTISIDIDSFPGSGGAPTIKWQDVQIPITRIKAVRIKTSASSLVEFPVELLQDLAASCGIYWQSITPSQTRFFYVNNSGFIRSTGYHITSGLVTAGKPSGYKLIIDYI